MSVPLAIRITSKDTGEQFVFSSLQQGNEFLGRSKGYLQNRIREQGRMSGENLDGEEFDIEILGKGLRRDLQPGQTPRNAPGIYVATLCWKCARASGFCRWSKELKPMTGWEASGTQISNHNSECESFFVENCPAFMQDGKTIEERKAQRKTLEEEQEREEERKKRTAGRPAASAARKRAGLRAAAQAMAAAAAGPSVQREGAPC